MKTTFSEASYLAQVRRLRSLAETALEQYPFRVKSIQFIHHGENTTFRVKSKDGQEYLLRVHRNDYHTKAAIQEELAWLAHLSKMGLSVPTPVRSIRDHFVQTIAHPHVPDSRNCSLFRWIDGRFIGKRVTPQHLYQVGQLIGQLQSNTPRSIVTTRRYWTAEGLVGASPKFGSIDKLADVRPKQQKVISSARRDVLKRLRQFEKKFPLRQGLIHADLHFGNILSLKDGIGAIDFDDCGYGFHVYDLVIPLLSVEGLLGEKNQSRLPEFKEALISGYSTKRNWDAHDERIYPHLITARKLAMLGWLNSRSDNPRLRKHLKGAIERVMKHLTR